MRPECSFDPRFFRCFSLWIFLVLILVPGNFVAAAANPPLETLNPNLYIVVTPLTTTPPPMITCDAPCACMLPSDAEAQWGSGGYTQCSELPCGRQLITSVAVVPVTKYCYQSNNYAILETSIVRQRACSAGLVSCHGVCVALDSDPNNCGSCGHSCSASQVCLYGQCRELMVEVSRVAVASLCSACLPNQSCCRGKCVDLQTDLENCGSCANTCPGTPPQIVCDNGHCINPCILQGISKGVTDCGGYCVNVLGSDTGNCGGCGKKCYQNQNCCLGKCSDPLSDNANCGGCMKPCSPNENCCNGKCIDVSNDAANCGGCGIKCAGENCCDGHCSNPHYDTSNCGGCGITCPPDANCQNGICTCTRPGLTICKGKCVSTDSDPMNCGSCGNTCSFSQTCFMGQCKNLCDVDPAFLDSFSWADRQGKNWMTPVKDQGACGACWAFGPVGATEAMYNIEHGTHKNIDLSEEELVSPCYGNGDAGDCRGGNAKKSFEYLYSGGLVTESAFPYQSINEVHSVPNTGDPSHSHYECNVQKSHCSTPPTCQDSSLGTQRWGVSSAKAVNANANDVKKALLCHGPLAVSSASWWHVVVLVGWNDTAQQWTVKNSWGTSPTWNGYNQIDYTGDPHGDFINWTVWAQGVTGP